MCRNFVVVDRDSLNKGWCVGSYIGEGEALRMGV